MKEAVRKGDKVKRDSGNTHDDKTDQKRDRSGDRCNDSLSRTKKNE